MLFGGELGFEVPVAGGPERDPLPLTVDDQPGRDRLHTPGRKPRHDLLPQHRRDLVPVEPVEDAARLVGVDLPVVQLLRVGDGARDRFGRDLVEDHPAGGDLRLQFLEQVPGDCLALAVLVSGEVELVGVLQQRLELGDLLLLVAGDDVERGEVVVDVDAEPSPGLSTVLLGDLRRLVGHVADVADARFDHVSLAQVAGDGARLVGRLHDHQPGAVRVRRGAVPGPRSVGSVIRGRLRLAGGLTSCWHALFNLTSASWPVPPAASRDHPARPSPQVPYAARPRNARPCPYPCNPRCRPDCSRVVLRTPPARAQ